MQEKRKPFYILGMVFIMLFSFCFQASASVHTVKDDKIKAGNVTVWEVILKKYYKM
ncbi:hypothetical protein BAMA111019_16595 [Bacillus manliponensis]